MEEPGLGIVEEEEPRFKTVEEEVRGFKTEEEEEPGSGTVEDDSCEACEFTSTEKVSSTIDSYVTY